MYDTVNLFLDYQSYPNCNFIETVPKYLTNIKSWGKNDFGEFVTGNLDNLKVKIKENGVLISGSICKFYLGNNFKTLSKGDTKFAIQKISDCLHLHFDEANVYRIDFGQNVIVKYPVNVYFKYFGQSRNYQRLEQSNGLYYNNQQRQLVFYDKTFEQKDKNQPIPELYANSHVLRYELRLKKHLKKHLKYPEIKAALLWDDEFYFKLVKRWKNEYLSIDKVNISEAMQPTGSKKELLEQLAAMQIKQLGQSNVLNMIKEWQGTGEINKKQAFQLRTCIKEVSKKTFGGCRNEIIQELDDKIKQASACW